MRGLLARAAGLLLLCAGMQAQEEPTEPRADAAPPADLSFDLGRAWSAEELAAAVSQMAAAAPDVAVLETIGTSRGGHELLVLTLTDPRTGAAQDKPSLLVFARGAQEGGGAEVALGVAARLVGESLETGEPPPLLSHCTIHVAPALDPDGGGEGAADFDRNFPVRWRPDSLRPGSGRTPLSEPETLALAEFLVSHPNISIALTFAGGGGGTVETALAGGDRLDLEQLTARGHDPRRPRILAWLGSEGGHPLDFAYEVLGIFPAVLVPGDAPAPSEGERRAAWVERAAEAALGFAPSLPQVALGEPSIERLGPGLFRLDLALSNGGLLPTLSEIGRDRRAAGPVELIVSGAKVVACAHRSGAAGRFAVEARAQERFPVGQIPGGRTTEVCLIVEADGGTVLELVGRSTRGGRARLEVTLP